MTQSRAKGNRFENDVCIALARWFDPSLPERPKLAHLPFRRRSTSIMPTSGHWEGHGDILHAPGLPHPWPFAVECKNAETWDLCGVLSNTNWPVWRWWRQAELQARAAGRQPLLVFKRNSRPPNILTLSWIAQTLHLAPMTGAVLEVASPSGLAVTVARLDDLIETDPMRLSTVSLPEQRPRSSRKRLVSPPAKPVASGRRRSRSSATRS